MEIKGAKALVFGGKTGLLGQAVMQALLDAEADPIALASSDCDVLDAKAVQSLITTEQPDLVFNCVAYTAVDLAEDEPDQARALNAEAPAIIGAACKSLNIPLIHYSTDFVFSGDKSAPYTETDEAGSTSVYGATKLDGETAVLALNLDKTLVIRISWLFGPGKINFVEKILGFAKQRERLTVVNDQTGSPSYTPDLAANTLRLLEEDAYGIFHLSNSGEATWHALASEAVKLAGIDCVVDPVPTEAFPTKAKRPPYSVLALDKFTKATGTPPRHWKDALADYVGNDLHLP